MQRKMTCPFCHAEQVKNAIFCSECGQYLLEDDKLKTEHYDSDDLVEIISPQVKPDSEFPTEPLGPLVIQLQIGSEKRKVELPLNQSLLIGRLDPVQKVFPEIDVTQDGRAAKSVSRRHATISRQGDRIVVEDLGSVNGTFINGKRLDPYMPDAVNHGDILHLGKLLIEINFRRL